MRCFPAGRGGCSLTVNTDHQQATGGSDCIPTGARVFSGAQVRANLTVVREVLVGFGKC